SRAPSSPSTLRRPPKPVPMTTAVRSASSRPSAPRWTPSSKKCWSTTPMPPSAPTACTCWRRYATQCIWLPIFRRLPADQRPRSTESLSRRSSPAKRGRADQPKAGGGGGHTRDANIVPAPSPHPPAPTTRSVVGGGSPTLSLLAHDRPVVGLEREYRASHLRDEPPLPVLVGQRAGARVDRPAR